MRYLLVIYRFLFFAIYTAWIVAEVFWYKKVLHADMQRVMAIRRKWAIRVLDGVGVSVSVKGNPPDIPCLILANHRSYLDPILILRQVNAFPVAKAELASWPLIGKGALWAGILYVQRGQGGSRVSTLKAISDTILKKGFPVILFPEGTTSDLPGMLPFNKGGLRTAAKFDLPVVPVAICFTDKRDFWVGEISFLKHAWQRFKTRKIEVELVYGPAIQNSSSDVLETEVRRWIEEELSRSSARKTEKAKAYS